VAEARHSGANGPRRVAWSRERSTFDSRNGNGVQRGAGDMHKVKVYTAGNCCYCHMAKDLLRRKGAAFEEIDVTGRSDLRADLCVRAGGRRTVPQIWIGSVHVGGCDDLFDLERSGKLDELLTHAEATR
jgi:glutaredoxin 3